MTADTSNRRRDEDRTKALVYEKKFAYRGMLVGLLLFFGSPFFVLMVHSSFNPRDWDKLFEPWIGTAMICTGMGGGVLVIVASVLFGLLIPSRVTQDEHDLQAGPLPSAPARRPMDAD